MVDEPKKDSMKAGLILDSFFYIIIISVKSNKDFIYSLWLHLRHREIGSHPVMEIKLI